MKKINDLSKKQDKELVELLIGGSQEAFGELYVRYKDVLLYCCKQYLNGKTGAMDIVQDIFMQVWETRDSLNAELSFSGYIHTLAHHRILNMYRQMGVHSRYTRHILADEKELTNETEDLIADNDYAALLNEIMESLPPKQKEVFRLSRIEGLKYKEISELLQISVPAVQKHASIALKKIKKYLQQHANIHFQAVIAFLMLFR